MSDMQMKKCVKNTSSVPQPPTQVAQRLSNIGRNTQAYFHAVRGPLSRMFSREALASPLVPSYGHTGMKWLPLNLRSYTVCHREM